MTSPPILKIQFVKAGRTAHRNRAYANYIARNKGSGVVLEDVRGPATTGDMHLRYLAERPRSHGLFTAHDDHPDLDEAMHDAAGRQGPSWRVIVTLRSEDAAELGLGTLKDWREFTRRYAPQFARALGYRPDQVAWWAAHHRPPGQGRENDPKFRPHVHIMIALNEGTPSRRGELSPLELRDARRFLAAEMEGPRRHSLEVQRTAARNALVAASREAAKGDAQLTPGQAVELRALLDDLARVMPGRGRAALSYLPPEATARARAIGDWLMAQDFAQTNVIRHEEATRALAAMYRTNTDDAWENARRDLRDRLSQAAVRQATRLHRDRTYRRKTAAQRLATQATSILAGHARRSERAQERGQARAVAETEAKVAAERLAEQGLDR